MTENENRPGDVITGPARVAQVSAGANTEDISLPYGLRYLKEDERQFVLDLDGLVVPIWTENARGDGKGEFSRPRAWQDSCADYNRVRLGGFKPGMCLCANTGGPLAVVDVDPRNGGDIDGVRQWLDGLAVEIFADVITPSGGRHFYIAADHLDVRTAHGKLPGLPGVDLQAKGANVFLPGTRRPKYDGAGYQIVSNDLAALRTTGDPQGAMRLTQWIAEHLPKTTAVPDRPWDGTPPDRRQQAYLDAVLANVTRVVAEAGEGCRNDTLNRSAFALGQFVAGAGLDCGRAEEALRAAADACGLPSDEADSTITSGMTGGMDSPRAVPEQDGTDPPGVLGGGSIPVATSDVPLVEGHELLDELLATLNRYVRFPDDHSAVAVALWVAATHGIEAWNAAPRLVLNSPQKRCGKTRALDVITGMCHTPLVTVNASAAAIFRSLGGERPPTLIIDEADAIFGTKRAAEQNEDLRSLLNAGYQRNRPALRCVGPQNIPQEFPTFAMVALAGIGAMPDTITDRAVNVTMRRRTMGEQVSQFRCRRDEPVLHAVRDRLATWAQANIECLTSSVPDMPVEDRAADTWEPLMAVADAAGGRWPQLARRACVALVEGAEESDEERSLDVRLLTDIRRIFTEKDTLFLPSHELVDALKLTTDSPWCDFGYTPSKLARRLGLFGVKPGHNAEKTVRGYRLESFHDAFERYTRPEVSSPSEMPSEEGR